MVLSYFKNLLSSFLEKRERFLIIEILKRHCRVSAVSLEPGGKKLEFTERFIAPVRLDDLSDYPGVLEIVKKFLKKTRDLSKYKFILSLDSNLATTIFSSISLIRNQPKLPIDEADLDNLISQASWKSFDRQRGRAAAKMGIDELDVLPGDTRILGVKLDGHRVFNPLGFKAKTIEVQLCQTFTAKNFIKDFKELFAGENISRLKGLKLDERTIFSCEAGAAWAYVISKINKDQLLRQAPLDFDRGKQDKPLLVANLFPEFVSVYLVGGSHLRHLNNLDWGENNLKLAVTKHLGVSASTAGGIIDLCNRGNASETVSRKIKKILIEELNVFVKSLEYILSRVESRAVYLNPFFNLPLIILSLSPKDKANRKTPFILVPDNFVGKNLGFDVKLKSGIRRDERLSAVVNLFAFRCLSLNGEMNKMAEKRMRWIT